MLQYLRHKYKNTISQIILSYLIFCASGHQMWPVTLVFQIETSLQLLHVMTEILFSAWNTLPTSEHTELLALNIGSLGHRPVLTHFTELLIYKDTDNIQTINVYIFRKVLKLFLQTSDWILVPVHWENRFLVAQHLSFWAGD